MYAVHDWVCNQGNLHFTTKKQIIRSHFLNSVHKFIYYWYSIDLNKNYINNMTCFANWIVSHICWLLRTLIYEHAATSVFFPPPSEFQYDPFQTEIIIQHKHFNITQQNISLSYKICWLTINPPLFAAYFPSHTFSDNKGQARCVDFFFFLTTIRPQAATGLVNGSRRKNSVHHLTMIRTRPRWIQVEPVHSLAATHLYMQQN